MNELEQYKQKYRQAIDEVRKLKRDRAELIEKINAEIKSKKDRYKSYNIIGKADVLTEGIRALEDIKYLIEKQ